MLDFDTTNINLGLERVSAVLISLGNPHLKFPAIHVAGTNGKGSVCSMPASILKEAGYKVGLFTSPQLFKWNERIKVNGVDISDEDFERLETTTVGTRLIASQRTPFEVITCMAFQYFAEQKIDIAVVEVGMGGRLDATNVVNPIITVITNIDFDHMQYLGRTIKDIAYEKSGIIKEGIPLVTAEKKKDALTVMQKTAEECGKLRNVPILNVELLNIPRSLLIPHFIGSNVLFQQTNVAVVLKVADLLREQGYKISDENIRAGLLNTRWPGRFQIISEEPLIIVDGAHNPAGAKVLKEFILSLKVKEKFTLVFGSQEDKDDKTMLENLSEITDSVIMAKSFHPKAKQASNSVKEAIETAKKRKKPILITGSLFIAAEALAQF